MLGMRQNAGLNYFCISLIIQTQRLRFSINSLLKIWFPNTQVHAFDMSLLVSDSSVTHISQPQTFSWAQKDFKKWLEGDNNRSSAFAMDSAKTNIWSEGANFIHSSADVSWGALRQEDTIVPLMQETPVSVWVVLREAVSHDRYEKNPYNALSHIPVYRVKVSHIVSLCLSFLSLSLSLSWCDVTETSIRYITCVSHWKAFPSFSSWSLSNVTKLILVNL